MTLTKRAISLIVALMMVFSAVAMVASVSAGAEDATEATTDAVEQEELVYLQKFEEKDFAGWVSTKDMGFEAFDEDAETGTVSYNEDGSIVIAKSEEYYGAMMDFKLTDEARKAYKSAVDGKVKVTFFANKALQVPAEDDKDQRSIMKDTQIHFYAIFKDGTSKKISERYWDMYNHATYSFAMVDADDNVLENLDSVDKIRVGVYHWNKYDTQVVISGLAVSGTPEISNHPTVDDIVPAETEDGAMMWNWDVKYRQDYSGGPSTLKYSPTGEEDSFKTRNTNGWMYWKNIDTANQTQVYYKNDRDIANSALMASKNGNNCAEITVNIVNAVNIDGNVPVQVEIQFVTFSGGYTTMISEWQQPGTTVTYYIDLSDLDYYDLNGVKVALQNYYYYVEGDASKTLLEKKWPEGLGYATYSDPETGEQKGTSKDGKTYISCAISNLEAYISPITISTDVDFSSEDATAPPVQVQTNATTKAPETTTADPNADTTYEHAGYHVYDFTYEAMDETYGNRPTWVMFLDDESWTGISFEGKYNEADPSKSTLKVTEEVFEGSDEYKKIIADSRSLLSGGYQVGLKYDKEYQKMGDIKQHQMSWFVAKSTTYADGTVKVNDALREDDYSMRDQIQKGLEYSMNHTDPNLVGKLAIDVYLVGAKNPHKGPDKLEDCSVEFLFMLHTRDGLYTVKTMKYVSIGKPTTIMVDISALMEEEGLGADEITRVHIAAQNYANTYQAESGKTGACGVTDVEMYTSAVYIPGDAPAGTVAVVEGFIQEDYDKLVELWPQIMGKLDSADYATYEEFLLLDEFVTTYINTSQATKDKFCEEFSFTEDMYAEYMYLWLDFDLSRFNSPSTGDMSLPVMAVAMAVVSGYIAVKTKKRSA